MNRAAKWTIGRIILMISPVLFLYGLAWHGFHAKKVSEERETASVIARFHERLNAADFDGICDLAYGCADSVKVRGDWRLVLENVRNRGGAFKSVVKPNILVSFEPFSIRADYISSFEKMPIREIFAMRELDGHLKIASYRTVTESSSRAEQ